MPERFKTIIITVASLLFVILLLALLYAGYIFFIKADQDEGSSKEDIIPRVTINRPSDGDIFYLSGDGDSFIDVRIDIEVKSKTDIDEVILFIDSKKVKIFKEEPYEYIWKVAKTGKYKISAKAGTSKGITDVSKIVEINVKENLNANLSEISSPTINSQSGKSKITKGISVFASSVLSAEDGNNYEPANVVDKKDDTCWKEGVAGYGLGEWIEIDFKKKKIVKRLGIINGDNKDAEHFFGNNRIKRSIIEFSDGSHRLINLEDTRQMQYINIIPKSTSSVRLYIDRVYKGDKWNDTAISEIKIYGE